MTDTQNTPDGATVATGPLDIQIVYVADPMCSWCYGFSDTIRALADQFSGRMDVWPLMGGLRAGNTQPMSKQDRAYIREAWGNVEAASGKPFDYDFFKMPNFVYDTEPACRAIVTMRYMHPEKTLDFLAFISRSFYAQGYNITDPQILISLAGKFGVDQERFARGIKLPDLATATRQDFEIAKALGVQGFPTLLAGNDDIGYTMMHSGFTTYDAIKDQFEDWYRAQQVI